MSRKIYLFVLILIIAATACKQSAVEPINNTGTELSLTSTEQQKVIADNAFTLSLYQNIATSNPSTGNFMLSPLSASMALGMTINGASTSTLSAMRSALCFSGFSQSQINSYYNKLITGLPAVDPNTTVNIANSIWYRQGFTVLQPFTDVNSASYQATVQALNFNSAAALQQINGWVNTKTNGKIPTIINQIPSDVMMYLINAIYFKSTWLQKFNPASTHKQAFTLPDNSVVQTDFMTASLALNTYSNADATIIELPYSNSKYSMLIVEPGSGKSIKEIAAALDTTKWQGWMSKLSPAHAELFLPKFKFSYNISLKNSLTSLGMGIAFTDAADFSLINGTGGLKITDVIHKTYIDVNEDGTEAAAITAVVVGTTAALNQTLTIDHPFIFAIREVKTGLIIFTGVVNDPTWAGN